MLYDKQVNVSHFDGPPNIVAKEAVATDDILSLIENRVGLGHWRLLPMGQVLTVSNCTARILNLPSGASGLKLKRLIDCFAPQDAKILIGLIEETIDKKQGFEATLRLYFRGEVKLVEIFCDVILDESGSLREVIGTLRDITKRAKQQALSQGRAAVMHVLMRNIPSAVAVLDNNMTYLSASNHWAAGHGLDAIEDLLGKCHYDLFPVAKKFKEEHQQVLSGEVLRRNRAFLKDSNGRPIEQLCVMCPWRTSHGVIGGMIIMLGTVDINKTLKFADKDPELQSSSLLELLERIE